MPLLEVFKKESNKVVDKQLDVSFDVKADAFYLVQVAARARAWWQRLPLASKDFWEDEELKIVFDNIPLKTKFNGNSLWGTRQIIFLLQYLSAGSHKISLLNKHKPFLETVNVYKVETFSNIDVLALTENSPEDTFLSAFISKSRPWITFYSQTLLITNVTLEAAAKDGWQMPFLQTDDEDLQIKINGARQTNDEPKSHDFWFWCGHVLKGKSKTFEKSFDRNDQINLIELISDRSPSVSKFLVSFRMVPTVGDPEWTGDFAEDTDEMLLARLILGEAEGQPKETKVGVGFTVLNRVKKQRSNWGFTVREVILKEDQYDAMWNKITWSKVRNPLANADEKRKTEWSESYEVSRGVLSGSLTDPTSGATNFHSFTNPEQFPPWATSGAFKIKIGQILFYELEG